MTQKKMYFSIGIGVVAVVLSAVLFFVWDTIYTPPKGPTFPEELSDVILPNPKTLEPFNLTDQDGKPFLLADFQGHWTFLFFGYTHCPDVCPMAMGILSEVFGHLKALSSPALEKTQVAFVTVDPKRDTPLVLKQYVSYFNPAFKGLSGSESQVASFTKQVGAIYFTAKDFKNSEGRKPPKTLSDKDIISHTSAFFLIDPLGRLVAIFPEYNNTDMILEEYVRIRKFVKIRKTYAGFGQD